LKKFYKKNKKVVDNIKKRVYIDKYRGTKKTSETKKRKGKQMSNLTPEQKSKRYDYLERCIIDYIDDKFQDERKSDDTIAIDNVIEDWLFKLEDHVPSDVYTLIDRICYDNYSYSSKEHKTAEYKNFLEKIGE